MAVIGTIRNRLGFILVFVVGLSLVLFIVQGLFSGNKSLFSGSSTEVGEVNGTSVSVQEFEQRYQQMVDEYKLRSGSEAIDNNTQDQLREQTWSQIINDLIFGKEHEALGLAVSIKELEDMVIGNNVSPTIKQYFTDPNTGIFNPAQVVNFLKKFNELPEQQKQIWLSVEKELKERRLAQKYQALLGGGLYVTNFEAKQAYAERGKTAKIRYLFQNFNSINDKDVTVSEGDIEKYYNEHKYEFKQENSRVLEYAVVDVAPSKEDREAIQSDFNKNIEEFKTTKDDSAFTARYSDVKYEGKFIKKEELPAGTDSSVFASSVGTVIGPVENNGKLDAYKVVAAQTRPDSVKARHILLPLAKPEDKDKVMARADSIKKALKAGAKFEELATKLSTDKGSAQKGGDLGWFTEGRMVKPFNDACFEGKKGDMPVVQSDFGIHIIEILDQTHFSKKIKVAILEKKLEPSSKTYEALYAKANELAGKIASGSEFEKTAAEKGVAKREGEVREGDRTVAGIDASREVVRWAFQAKKNEVSKVFEAGNKYVVARLKDIKEKGTTPLEQVKEQITFLAKRDKKAETMIKNLTAKIAGASNIDAAASKSGIASQVAENVSFAMAGIPGVGREPEVIGNTFALKQGQLSKPIKGNLGVFVIQVDAFQEPAPTKDYTAEKNQLAGNAKSRISYDVYNTLKEKANIKDTRYKFF